MKVDLEKINLGHSPLTDKIFAGTSIKPGVWRNKIDVTNDFIGCVIARWAGHKESIKSSDGKVYEITVKEVTKKRKQ
jgi:hypothetical protein